MTDPGDHADHVTSAAEWGEKQQKLAAFLDQSDLDAVLLWQRPNFAWATGGGDNHILSASQVGVAAILATRTGRHCLTANIEADRIKDEELDGTDIAVHAYDWHSTPGAGLASMLRDLGIDASRVASDDAAGAMGVRDMPGEFVKLRWQLTEAERNRYLEGGARTAGAIEQACVSIEPGMDEMEIAGTLDHCMLAAGVTPVVSLVATDERIHKYRHPIPTGKKLKKHSMLVTCASFGGLITNVTRFVYFGNVPGDLAKKQQSVCNVDAAANFATRPGRSLGDILADIQQAYADEGVADEWKLHHQGGSTGYAGREVFATPGEQAEALKYQAFAWNPSITGTKSEDTIIVDDDGFEIVSGHSEDWPTVVGKCKDGELPRPGILTM